jgi:hypothetical protein
MSEREREREKMPISYFLWSEGINEGGENIFFFLFFLKKSRVVKTFLRTKIFGNS